MRNIPLITVAAFVLLILATGCKGMVFVESIDDSIEDITARHDAYIAKDASLTDPEKKAFLGEAKALREVVEAAR